MPLCELCLNEPQVDTTEIDKMLDEVYNPTTQSKARQMMQSIDIINENLRKNISILENSPTVENDNVSRVLNCRHNKILINLKRQLRMQKSQ